MPDHPQTYCLIRKEWVSATPEEKVRQQLMQQMVYQLGYPVSYIAVEKELRQMPHLPLVDQNIPDRRFDVVCFGKDIHASCELYPLLLIECKAIPLSPKVINQVVGYNHFVKAYYLAIANQDEIRVGWYDAAQKNYRFVNYLPTYTNLLNTVVK